jgi:actin-related protein
VFAPSYVINEGDVTNWDRLQQLWRHAFSRLKVAPSQHAVLLCDGPATWGRWRGQREKMVQLMMEYEVPLLYVEDQASLSACYAHDKVCGRTAKSLVSVVVGEGCSYSLPFIDEYPHVCVAQKSPALANMRDERRRCVSPVCKPTNQIGYWGAACYDDVLRMGAEAAHKPYRLYEKYCDATHASIVPEALFQPSLLGAKEPGLQQIVQDSIQKCDSTYHKELYANICLAGRGTLMDGLAERLRKEVQKLTSLPVRVRQGEDKKQQQHAAWVGGAVFASNESFIGRCISKAEYDEGGRQIVHRKCF